MRSWPTHSAVVGHPVGLLAHGAHDIVFVNEKKGARKRVEVAGVFVMVDPLTGKPRDPEVASTYRAWAQTQGLPSIELPAPL